MKKHLLLILALLAFVLPARAASLLINFVGNDDNRTSNTKITAGMNLNQVFTGFVGDEVTYPLVISNYVSSITAANNAYYNDINSMRLGANGSLTFKLAKKYKVTGYDIRGYKKTDVARVTINGHTVDGPTVTTNSGQQSNVPVQLSATEETDQIAISTDKEVYIKGICIYYETEASELTVNVAPAPGTYNVGQVVMAMSNNSSAALKFFVDKKSSDGSYSENVLDQDETGSASYTFSEPGDYRVTAQAHYGGYGNWDNSSEQFIGYYTIAGNTPEPDPTLSVDLKTGTYKYPQKVTVKSSKTDDEFFVTVKNDNVTLVNGEVATGSYTYTFPGLGKYTLSAENLYESKINETYTITGDPCPLTITPANTNITTGTEIKVASSVADASLLIEITKDGTTFVNEDIFDNPYTFTPTEPGVYEVKATASATGYEDTNKTATYTVNAIPCPIEITPASGNVTTGTDVVVSTVSGASLQITITKDGVTDINGEYVASPFRMTLTQPGTYTFTAVASATGYITSEKSATYTVTAPVREEVAPVISFSHEDQKVFGSEDEIDVTLSLNSDVYPVPDVIYYTLDGFMAHNTLETGNPGATPAGHVLPVAVDPATLSGTVRIERSHREVLNHRAVTINAYAFNTAGNDVAAATYIFNDNAAPLPDPQPTTITATVTMANQGWTSGQSPYTADNSFTATWTSDKIVDLDNATISFATVATSEGTSYPAFNSKNTPKGLRFYSTSTNDNTITVNVPDDSYRFVSVIFTGTNSLKVQGTTYTSGTKVDLTDKPSSIVLQSAVTSTMAVSKIEFVLEKTAAKAAVAPVNTKTATNVNTTVTFSTLWSSTGTKYTDGKTTDWTSDDKSFTFVTSNTGGSNKPGYFTGSPAGLRLYNGNKITVNAPNGYSFVSVKPTSSDPFKYDGVEKASGSTITFNSGTTSFTIEPKTAKKAISKLEFVLAPLGGSEDPTVEAPVISLSERANTTEPVTVTIDCATEGATVKYTVKKDGTTVADDLTYDAANKPVYSAVGSYTVDATATLGTASANATQATFEITEPEKPNVATPEITLSTQAKPSDPVTVTIDCATDGATINYTVTKDGTTVADNLTYDPASKPVFSEVGSYTVNATASKEGMNPANAAPANFTIEKLVEVIEELFFVMDQNFWDVDGAYPETVVPFEYKGNNTYDLEIASIPAKGWYMNKDGIWTAIENGFRGNFYVRDGKANHKGLVFGATGTVADATFATRAAAAGNQMVEPHTKYNMYVVNEGETHKVFTTIDDNSSKAFTDGTIRVTHTPGNKDAAKTMTLEILAEDNQTTGVDSITAEDAANDADARFFNLQGVEVPADRLAPGIYIRQAGNRATKVLVK